MRRIRLIQLASLGSAALLAGAFGFQYLGGMVPCPLCLLQRWPHAAAVVIGALALIWPAGPARLLAGAGALAALATSGIGLYHTGIERQWWQGPDTCTSGAIDQISATDLLDQILAAPIVRCDEVVWDMFGLSMASWNALISLALVLIWIRAALPPAPTNFSPKN